jgi:hypothetical protein
MINSIFNVLQKVRYFFGFSFIISFISCGSFNSTGYVSNDGIYEKKVSVDNTQKGPYYKNYFDQKAEEYGLNDTVNDSIVTDINSYSSQTNSSKLAYSDSYGSWGDNPTSINFIYRDNPLYASYWGGLYNPYSMNWYDPYSSFYNPFYSWGYYPYERYGRYGYWNFMFRPWGYSNYWGYGGAYNNYSLGNERYSNNNIAYMSGRRGTNSNTSSISSKNGTPGSVSTTSSGRGITNYNVGRKDMDLNKKSDNLNSDETNKTRNINRVYFALKNSRSLRNYQNEGEIINTGGRKIRTGGGNISTQNNKTRPYTRPSSNGKSSFQMSKYNNSSSGSYSPKSSSGSTNNSTGRSYDVSRSNSSSNNSSMSRSSYSPPPSSSIRSSGGGRTSSPPPTSGGSSRGRR